MHMRGRHILKFYPVLVKVFDSDHIVAIWNKYQHSRKEDIPNIGAADVISVNDVDVPITMSEFTDPQYGFYFYFPKDHPSVLEFKLKYTTG